MEAATRWWCPVHGYDIRPVPTDDGVPRCGVEGCVQLPSYETARGWVEPSPARCPAGHELGPGRVGLSWLGCINPAHPGVKGHRTWTCDRCQAVVYGPPRREGCRLPGR